MRPTRKVRLLSRSRFNPNNIAETPLSGALASALPDSSPAAERMPSALVYKPVYRLLLVREGAHPATTAALSTPALAADVARTFLNGTDREQFVVLLLNGKNKLIGINVVSVGSLSASIVHPREVFKGAIAANACAIICVHNHPSGEPDPSAEDREITKRINSAGQILGIRLLDHLIVGDGTNNYFSFVEHSLLQPPAA